LRNPKDIDRDYFPIGSISPIDKFVPEFPPEVSDRVCFSKLAKKTEASPQDHLH
jgi:hypothetical protein